MRRVDLIPAIILASLLAGLGAISPAVAAEQGADEAALRVQNASEVADFMASDAKGLDSLWADTFVVTNPLNHFGTKAEVLGMVNSGVLRFTSYDRKIEYIRRYGEIAIVAGSETVVWAGKLPMAGMRSNLRFTAVWRLSGSGWREVARHANIVPEH